MSEKNMIFNDKNINKSKFYKNNKLFTMEDVDINKILVSKKEPYGNKGVFNYFIGYNDNDKRKPLCISFLK